MVKNLLIGLLVGGLLPIFQLINLGDFYCKLEGN